MKHMALDSTDSTNAEAKRQLAKHPGEVLVITAKRQTAGRGRLGRSWHSPEGGVWLSVVWPMSDAPARYDPVPLLAGLAALRTVRSALNRATVGARTELRLKWPNDVLMDDRKVAGVLCERVLADDLPDGAVPSVIIGAGINANFDRRELGDDLRFPPITLRERLDAPADLDDLTRSFVEQITTLLEDLERRGLSKAMVSAAEARLAWLLERVEVDTGTEQVTGRVRGLDARGQLQLEVDGEMRVISVGEVRQVRRAQRSKPVAAGFRGDRR